MRWLLLADIHANLEALDAVLQAADRRWGALPILCAGDVVGYGPDPNGCIERLRGRAALCVAGNHDLQVLGRLPRPRFTPEGLRAIEWTRARLEEPARAWLAALPSPSRIEAGVFLCHGSPADPDEYTDRPEQARAQLAWLAKHYPEAQVVLCGHTHRALWADREGVRDALPGCRVPLPAGRPLLLNPGSVGQSRTAQPAARFALLDLQQGDVTYHAAPYDVRACACKMRQAGLRSRLYLPAHVRWLRRCRRAIGRLRARGEKEA
jgi:predicted phosphodiesterase